ncbi:SNF2 family DNA-dependent ATPase-like protein [Phanerochaete sordida]|uniref:SNF2 family DNA-dependent ATPase-like protein n=1 Tax=Phanerochaete sordida TaxID=48140 RepID=A0A9P3GHG1_9APHY|nr:SNF2 family DNA-dependent ATPase-like protein [Phanerochaete sordida]
MAIQKTTKTKQATLVDMFSKSAASSSLPSTRASSPPASTTVASSPAPSIAPPDTSPAASPASSPMPETEMKVEDEELEDEEEMSPEDKEKWEKLEPFLEKVRFYARVLKEQMDTAKIKHKPAAKPPSRAAPTKSTRNGRNKRTLDHDDASSRAAKRVKTEASEGSQDEAQAEEVEEMPSFKQPAFVTGGTLKDFQLEGVAWMVGLYHQGISGILADEMGLGKVILELACTLQTIAFHAWLRECSAAPFMVVCPLSVLSNWADEFKKFTPDIPICVYRGTPAERAELRKKVMVIPEQDKKYWLGTGEPWKQAAEETSEASTSTPSGRPKKAPAKRKAPTKGRKPTRRGIRSRKPADDEAEDEDDAQVEADSDGKPKMRTKFPVILTTYETVMKDEVYLAQYKWGFIVVDEGHRLKNFESKLHRSLKAIPATGRMVLTGTPLQNNLAELWSLLNFVLPDLFTDLDTFQDWFNMPETAAQTSPRVSRLISSLHAILRPFLLRRLKADVLTNMPPKKEYVLYAPLSLQQRALYDAILDGHLRALLMKEGKLADETAEAGAPEEAEEGPRRSGRRRGKQRRTYDDDGNDKEYFRRLENGELDAERERRANEKTAEELGKEWQRQEKRKSVNNKRLQNILMQLRKVCSHPYLFDWPEDPVTKAPILDATLVEASGKMLLLDQLLTELFARGHKVLLFSQFTTMLDIIDDWAHEIKRWDLCRIDGSTPMETRREEVARFQNGGDAPDAPKLFILSTRAGGLGLNLVAADTVIFYDGDWNPQVDLQAQARAHRIGQTKPVLSFRLVTAHTVEERIMQRAAAKRRLEALVIARGAFRTPQAALEALGGVRRGAHKGMAELAKELLGLEGEHVPLAGGGAVLARRDLDALLERGEDVFAGRGQGWTSDAVAKPEETRTAFAVYEAPVDEGGDALAGMMGADEDEDGVGVADGDDAE